MLEDISDLDIIGFEEDADLLAYDCAVVECARLASLRQAIAHTMDSRASLSVLEADSFFTARYGEDPGEWLQNLDAHLNKFAAEGIEPGTEGMKTQDALRWGIAGYLVGLYLSSFKRIRKAMLKVEVNPPTITTLVSRVAQYLPDYKIFQRSQPVIEKIQDQIMEYGRSNELLSFEQVVKDLKRLKIELKDNVASTDWNATIWSLVGQVVFSAALGPVGAYPGTIIGLTVSDAGKPIGTRGWTKVSDYEAACDWMLKTLKKHYDISEAFKDAKQIRSKEGFTKAELKSHKKAVRLLRSVFRAYAHALRTIGRGLAGVQTMGSL